MGFAEDSRKIERIASGSAEGLALMYEKRLQVITHLLKPNKQCALDCMPKLTCQAHSIQWPRLDHMPVEMLTKMNHFDAWVWQTCTVLCKLCCMLTCQAHVGQQCREV